MPLMKKSILHTLLFASLLALSLCAHLYVNVSAIQTNSKTAKDKIEKKVLQETEETTVILPEVEVLKKLIKQGASKLPTPNI